VYVGTTMPRPGQRTAWKYLIAATALPRNRAHQFSHPLSTPSSRRSGRVASAAIRRFVTSYHVRPHADGVNPADVSWKEWPPPHVGLPPLPRCCHCSPSPKLDGYREAKKRLQSTLTAAHTSCEDVSIWGSGANDGGVIDLTNESDANKEVRILCTIKPVSS
jgi:hypothetical protein